MKININYQYEITESDFIDYYKILIYEIRGNKIINKFSILLFLCFMWFFYMLIKLTLLTIIIFSILIIFVFIIVVITPLTTSVLAKKAFDKNTYLKQINEYKIDANNIYITTGNFRSIIKWKSLEKYYETNKNIYCLFEYNQVLIIPKKLVNVNKVIELIKNHLSHINTKK